MPLADASSSRTASERDVLARLRDIQGVSPEDTAAGVALAHSLIEPVLANLRERVRQAQAAAPPPFAVPDPSDHRPN